MAVVVVVEEEAINSSKMLGIKDRAVLTETMMLKYPSAAKGSARAFELRRMPRGP